MDTSPLTLRDQALTGSLVRKSFVVVTKLFLKEMGLLYFNATFQMLLYSPLGSY